MNNFISYDLYKKYSVLNETYDSYIDLKKLAQIILRKTENKEIKSNETYFIKDLVDIEKSDTYKMIQDVAIRLYFPNFEFSGSFLPPTAFNRTNAQLKKYGLLNELQFSKGLIIIHGNKYERILHELSHAYNWYRSKGKNSNMPLKKSYQAPGLSGDQFNRRYYNSTEEIHSFFLETISKLDFFDENGHIKNINNLYNEFKKIFGVHYELWNTFLTPKVKKILAHKFAQYYHKLKERNISDE